MSHETNLALAARRNLVPDAHVVVICPATNRVVTTGIFRRVNVYPGCSDAPAYATVVTSDANDNSSYPIDWISTF